MLPLSHPTFYAAGQNWIDFLIPALVYGMVPLSLVLWIWQRRHPINPATAPGGPGPAQAGKLITLWVVLGKTGALVYLDLNLVTAVALSRGLSQNPHLIPQTRSTSALGILRLAAAAGFLFRWASTPFRFSNATHNCG